ncbi:hypothetical protein COU20_03005 [Candidatus Kaiserbacteria bacterium CG10_big_fil_rev_8_21_14_0_10_59_10]|uniref:Prepilin-type N-terminal cleavage/methylation domain-containing protein n=1 Tax=Candidatus Kaiserbacteria bacterium CG10_big_fil_rev_8_21_14_0_10_59_10 TaxID=1974612 RepID=A0A2H0U7B5_9BACT|nr:MAG: hypothetical protein COU20_03005 [Candidatus Kaiserbacteria bacterium CG10_big_fil_rev_8_21_14_0_10_59_10]
MEHGTQDVKGAERGYTLVETVIVFGLFAFIAIVVIALIQGYGAFYRAHNSSVDVVRSASMVMNEVRTAALQASQAVSSHTFPEATVSTGENALVLQLPSIEENGAVIPGSFDYVAFHASGSDAYRLLDTAVGSTRHSGSKKLGSSVESLSFSYDNQTPSLITYIDAAVHTRADVSGRVVESELSQRIYLRNR